MTAIVAIESVDVEGERQRKEFDQSALLELSDSIQEVGLLHPIVVKRTPEGLVLVAGERRLRAMEDIIALGGQITYEGKNLPAGHIPVTELDSLTDLQSMEAEYAENIKRTDLTWAEKAAATAKLMEMRKAQRKAAGLEEPTVAEIAQEVRGSDKGWYHTETKKELIVAQHLDNPKVAGAKDLSDAFLMLKREENRERHERLAEIQGTKKSTDMQEAVNADCLEWLPEQPSGIYDCIVTDPPYGIGADKFGDCGNQILEGQHLYEDSPDNLFLIQRKLPSELYRVAKDKAHAYIFCDIGWFSSWKGTMEGAGWKVFRTPLIWFNINGFRAPWPTQGPQRQYECILYAVKGDKETTGIYSDVMMHRLEKNLGVMSQKPTGLFADLISRSCEPGDRVLDPFSGSGTIFVSAYRMQVHATGVELDPASYGIGLERIKDLENEE